LAGGGGKSGNTSRGDVRPSIQRIHQSEKGLRWGGLPAKETVQSLVQESSQDILRITSGSMLPESCGLGNKGRKGSLLTGSQESCL
jgi:hypothetical protein